MIDLFAGTGAFSRAFENYDIQCCFANDFCKNSQKIFEKNHKNHKNPFVYGDLNDIKNEDIPKHNICTGNRLALSNLRIIISHGLRT